MKHPNLLSSTNSSEDASVFKVGDNFCLIQSVDLITPIVDDPYLYGQIAAANSLSDIFAMGGQVSTALNILGFDCTNFDLEIASEIMAGGASKVVECGGALVGGHSVSSPEMLYGLSVTGFGNVKDGFWANNTAKIGDLLILTKPLGIGVMATALKGGLLNSTQIIKLCNIMAQLNFYALKALHGIKVNAATDVTGFGFFGHLSEMGRDDIAFLIDLNKVPILLEALELASMGIISEGSYKNHDYSSKFVGTISSEIKLDEMLFYDGQTSGGLLISVAQKDAQKALDNLRSIGYEYSNIIGEVTRRQNADLPLINIKA